MMTPAHRIDRRTPVPGGRTGNGVSGENQNGTDKEAQPKVLHWLLDGGEGGQRGRFGKWLENLGGGVGLCGILVGRIQKGLERVSVAQ